MMSDQQSLPDTPVSELDLRGVISSLQLRKDEAQAGDPEIGAGAARCFSMMEIPSAMSLVALRTKAIRYYRRNESSRPIGS